MCEPALDRVGSADADRVFTTGAERCGGAWDAARRDGGAAARTAAGCADRLDAKSPRGASEDRDCCEAARRGDSGSPSALTPTGARTVAMANAVARSGARAVLRCEFVMVTLPCAGRLVRPDDHGLPTGSMSPLVSSKRSGGIRNGWRNGAKSAHEFIALRGVRDAVGRPFRSGVS